jgi:hypothetical protein
MNSPIPAPPRPRLFMQHIVGAKWASYSGRLVFYAVPEEIRSVSKSKPKRGRIANPSLLELRTFHVKS